MAQRLGLGPVFAFEWITRSRRWQGYAIRCLFVMALLAGLGMIWRSTESNIYLTTRQRMVQAGESFFFTMTITELALVLLAAPAATAGAICLDKARGSLAHVMVTDLTDREVVLGKLGARLVPVLTLIACALPVSALGTLMGGIDPVALSESMMIACGLAFLGCSLALTLSVWMAKAHEVMLVVFAVWILWLMALPVCYMVTPGNWAPRWLEVCNPFWLAMAPSSVPGQTSMIEPFGFLFVCLAISGGLAALSVRKVRPVYLDQSGRPPKPVKASRLAGWYRRQVKWWPGPSLDTNPVLWREWHRNRPSKATRIVWGLYIVLTTLFSLKVIWDYRMIPNPRMNGMATLLNAFQVTIGLLLVSATAGTVLSEERVRGSLDVLISTPLTTRSILWGKWWGAFRKVPWLAFWPYLVMYAILPPKPPGWIILVLYLTPALIVAQGAAIASLGLAMATWISRTGRAVTWTISALIASVIGWPVIGIMLFGDGESREATQFAVMMGSPFFNSAMSAELMELQGGRGPQAITLEYGIYRGMIVWTIVYSLLALGLFLATLWTFDRCLGRTPDRPVRRVGRAVRPTPVKGSGWRTRRAGGRPGIGAASCGPPPR